MSGRGQLTTRRRSPAALATCTALFCVAFTVAVTALPFVRFAYRAPALHVALETVNAIVGLLVAFLVYGRFRESARRQEMLLALGLCSVAIANLVLTALPSAVTLGRGEEADPWAALAIRLIGTLLIAAAALTSATRSTRRAHFWPAVAALAGLVLVIGVLGNEYADRLPPPVDLSRPLGDATSPSLISHPAVLAVQAVGAALYAIAAVAFTRQSARSGDQLMHWVGAGCVLAAAARVHYVLFPSLYSEYVYAGDALRLCSYLFMLVGAAREIRSYWELRARTAVLEERRRMARDLHDGLAQELSYIWTRSRSLVAQPGDAASAQQIGAAAERALDEARRAIASLTRPLDEPFVQVLQRVADDLAARYGVKLRTDLDPEAALAPRQQEAAVRIVAEAVRNAVRHGPASSIDLVLTARPLCLTITDDGHGFFPGRTGQVRVSGFGIMSMRERAEALGARFAVTSAPGTGTTVRVTWV